MQFINTISSPCAFVPLCEELIDFSVPLCEEFSIFLLIWHGICYILNVGGSNQNPVAVMGCQPRVALKVPGPGLEKKPSNYIGERT